MRHFLKLLVVAAFLMGTRAPAFTLLGPYADWMDQLKGYRLPGDIGGPMDINEEYRWNIPVVYYGFDQGFLNAFGEEGVASVEEAIVILNALPPAAEIALEDFPLDAIKENYAARAQGLHDLRTAALIAVIEQMGLAKPERYIFTYRDIEITSQQTNFQTIQRSFDPVTLDPSSHINEKLYDVNGYIFITNPPSFRPNIYLVDPLAYPFVSTIAGNQTSPGYFATGLSRDDAGGLRYLLSSTNWNFEPLISGVFGVGESSSNLVVTARRPGVEKIQFVRLDFEASENRFVPVTNQWVDTFSVDDEIQQQNVARVVSTPDILFSAKDFGIQRYLTPSRTNGSNVYPPTRQFFTSGILCSDTSPWINCSLLNTGTNGAGPGIIVPGAKITFPDNSRYYSAASVAPMDFSDLGADWLIFSSFLYGRFDGTPNAPVILSTLNTNIQSLTLDLRASITSGVEWVFLANVAADYEVDCSTNLIDWETVQTITNSTGLIRFIDTNFTSSKFYRTSRSE